jgi:hypothetical protein
MLESWEAHYGIGAKSMKMCSTRNKVAKALVEVQNSNLEPLFTLSLHLDYVMKKQMKKNLDCEYKLYFSFHFSIVATLCSCENLIFHLLLQIFFPIKCSNLFIYLLCWNFMQNPSPSLLLHPCLEA